MTEVIAIEPEPTLRAAAERAAIAAPVAVTVGHGTAEALPLPDAAIEAAGLTIARCERFGLRASALEPSVPHILGVARRP